MKKPYLKESRYVTALCVWVPDAIALIKMCQHDSCYPASEAEVYKVERLINQTAAPVDHIIRLVRAARGEGPPTLGRWRSFAAYVLDVRHPQEMPLTDAELAHLAKINLDLGGGT